MVSLSSQQLLLMIITEIVLEILSQLCSSLIPIPISPIISSIVLIVGRLMMEKFDGVRVYWDGKRLFSTSSRSLIQVPQDLQFPTTPFEGELWYMLVVFIYLLYIGWDITNGSDVLNF